MLMEMNFPHNRRRDAEPVRSSDFDRLVSVVLERQASDMASKFSDAVISSLYASGDPLVDRIGYFGSAVSGQTKNIGGAFLPQEMYQPVKVNECEADVYPAALANRKSTDHKVDLPDEPVALRGMEN